MRGQEQGAGGHDGDAEQAERQAGAREQRPQASSATSGRTVRSAAAAQLCMFANTTR